MLKKQLCLLVELLKRPFTEEWCFVAFMFALGLTCIIFEPWNSLRLYSLSELPGDVYLLALLLTLLPAKWRRPLTAFTAALLYVIAFIDNLFYVAIGSPLSASLLRAVINTTSREAGEAIHAFSGWHLLFSQLPIILSLAVAHIYCAGHRSMRRFQFESHPSLLSAAMVLAICSLVFGSNNKRYLFHRLVLSRSDTELPQSIMDMSVKTGYYLPVYRCWKSVIELSRHLHAVRMLPLAQQDIPIDNCTFRSPRILLVIGESLNKSHCGLYGYHLPTTPRLCKREKQGELIAFSNVISPWNFTSEALEHLLSLHSYGDKGQWYEYPLFTSVFRQAGYGVAFISNQYTLPAKKAESFIDTQLLNDSLLDTFQFTWRNSHTHTYDEGLLADYDSLAPKMSAHNLMIVHLLGQHVEFSDRVPPARHHFQPSDYDRRDLSPGKRAILADYDNAVLYGDSVTDMLLSRENNRESIVIFVSDHGERVFDANSQQYGRSNSLSPVDVRQQYEVPMWIWASPSYRRCHPEIIRALRHAANLPFSTDRLSHLLLFLAGIRTPLYRPQLNPLSTRYSATRPRLVRGLYNYESLIFP